MPSEISFPAPGGVALLDVLTVPDPGGVLGMTEEMRRVARDLSARGRMSPQCVARAIRTTLRGDGPELADLDGVRDRLARRPDIDPDRTRRAPAQRRVLPAAPGLGRG